MERQTLPKRLESLDALRGLDLFFLVAFGPLIRSLIRAADVPWLNSCAWLFKHQFWTGFSPWDLIMPLFLFMSGITIPFAYSRYKTNPDKKPLVRRLVKRVLLLWLFGMIVQGNLRALDPDHIYFYTNTLQTIAVGYLLFFIYILPGVPRLLSLLPYCCFIGPLCNLLKLVLMEAVIIRLMVIYVSGLTGQ